MTLEFRFPDVGEGIAQGEIVRWLVAPGDEVRADQPLVEVETDKAVVEIPAPRAGTILRLPVAAGETIQVGEILAVIGDPDDGGPRPRPRRSPKRPRSWDGWTPKPWSCRRSRWPPGRKTTQPRTGGFSPFRRCASLARDLGVDLSHVTPSGPRGRIRREDVLQAAPPAQRPADAQQDAHGPIELQPLSALRRTIAKAMVEAATTAVPITTIDEVDVSELLDWRARSNAASDVHLTLLPFIMKAVVAALKQHPGAQCFARRRPATPDRQALLPPRHRHRHAPRA